MRIFTPQDKMVNLIRVNYQLLPVLNRFGIRLGFKDSTVAGICEEKEINPDFFLSIVNTFHNPGYFPEEKLISFSPLLIIRYLKKTHRYYVEYLLPKLEQLLHQLIQSCQGNCSELSIIEAFYKRYKSELNHHIEEEENKVFPYILNLIHHPDDLKSGYSIRQFEKEHSNVEVQINDLKNLVIKYLEPVYDDNICHEFLMELFRFEKDILDHARIEDKILVPQVRTLEKKCGR